MNWEEENQNLELYNFYKTMIALRKNNKALIYGNYKKLYCKDNVLVFERSYKGETLVVAINNNDDKYLVKLPMENEIILEPMGFKILNYIA